MRRSTNEPVKKDDIPHHATMGYFSIDTTEYAQCELGDHYPDAIRAIAEGMDIPPERALREMLDRHVLEIKAMAAVEHGWQESDASN